MSIATDMRDQYIAAEAAILKGQSYRWGERYLTRANLAEVQAGRREWARVASVEAAQAGARRDMVGVKLADFSGFHGPEGQERFR